VEIPSPNSVIVRDALGFGGLDHVIYTDFNPSGKVAFPDPRELARAAIDSVMKAKAGQDGISYLRELLSAGVVTALTGRYVNEILAQTNSNSLSDALDSI
jgi:hypothetical protein